MLSGCGGLEGDGSSALDDGRFTSVVPTPAMVSVDVPTNDTSGLALGDPAPLYQLTHGVSSGVNAHVGVLLTWLKLITLFPPSERGETYRVWGPSEPKGLEDVSYRFRVDQVSETLYSFKLEGRSKGETEESAFKTVISGEVTPDSSNPLKSSGQLELLFTNHKDVSITECRSGTIKVDWDTTTETRVVGVQWDGFVDCQQKEVPNSTYHYTQAADASGTFEFISETNIHTVLENKPGLETVKINSRWMGNGTGRSDVILSGDEVSADLQSAQLNATEVKASQCWSELFAMTFSDTDPDELEALVYEQLGAETDCAFETAAYPQL